MVIWIETLNDYFGGDWGSQPRNQKDKITNSSQYKHIEQFIINSIASESTCTLVIFSKHLLKAQKGIEFHKTKTNIHFTIEACRTIYNELNSFWKHLISTL